MQADGNHIPIDILFLLTRSQNRGSTINLHMHVGGITRTVTSPTMTFYQPYYINVMSQELHPIQLHSQMNMSRSV